MKFCPKDVCAHKNGWMMSELMEDWLKVNWNRCPGALCTLHRVLFMGFNWKDKD